MVLFSERFYIFQNAMNYANIIKLLVIFLIPDVLKTKGVNKPIKENEILCESN